MSHYLEELAYIDLELDTIYRAVRQANGGLRQDYLGRFEREVKILLTKKREYEDKIINGA